MTILKEPRESDHFIRMHVRLNKPSTWLSKFYIPNIGIYIIRNKNKLFLRYWEPISNNSINA